jgi:hypothetical protein
LCPFFRRLFADNPGMLLKLVSLAQLYLDEKNEESLKAEMGVCVCTTGQDAGDC